MLRNGVQFGLTLLVLSFLISCEKTEVHTGSVGNYLVIKAKPPMGIDNPTYDWVILNIPEPSQLGYSDIILEEEGSRMTFSPDEQGDYLFELIIYDSTGDEIAAQKYLFNIDKPVFTDAAEQKEKIEEVQTEINSELTIDKETPEDIIEDDAEIVSQKVLLKDTMDSAIQIEEAETDFSKEESVVEEKQITVKKISAEIKPQNKTVSSPDISLPPAYDRFTIQVSSWNNLEDAKTEMNNLIKLGFDAYIQKIYFSELDEIWYRIRIGAFKKYSDANHAAKEISNIIQKVTWVDNIRLEY